jgi:hypothetical protein
VKERDLIRIHVMWMLALVGLIVVYCRWWSWYGGWSWGPRFFLLAAFPATLALCLWAERAKSAWSALAASVVIGWAFWVGFDGLVFGVDDLGICTRRNYRLESLCWYVPEFSPLIRPFVAPRELVEWELNASYVFIAAYLRVTAVLWWTCLRQISSTAMHLRSDLLPRLREFRF